MAITVTALDSGTSATDATSYATASISPGANSLILLVQYGYMTGISNVPTVSGNSLTWVNVISSTGGATSFNVFRAMGASPSAGAATIDFAGQTQKGCGWSVIQFDNIDTSGTNGSGAIVQSSKTYTPDPFHATSIALTLSAFGSSNNIAYGAVYHNAAEATTPGSGFTEVHDVNLSDGADAFGLETEYKSNSTAVGASWASDVFAELFGIEIKCATSSFNIAPTMLAVF